MWAVSIQKESDKSWVKQDMVVYNVIQAIGIPGPNITKEDGVWIVPLTKFLEAKLNIEGHLAEVIFIGKEKYTLHVELP